MPKSLTLLAIIVGLGIGASAQTAPKRGQPPTLVPPPMSETGSTIERSPRVLQLAHALDKLSISLTKGADVVEEEVLDGIISASGADPAMEMVRQWRKLAKLEKGMAALVRQYPDLCANDERWTESRDSAISLYVAVNEAASIVGTPAGMKAALKDVGTKVRRVVDLTKPGLSW